MADPPAAIKELSDLVAGFKPGGDLAHHTLLLAPEVHALLASMLEVATHVDSLAAKQSAAAQKAEARRPRHPRRAS